ncbi:hypothetical protein [Sphingomonas sp. 28-62-11]|uniref:hypothetical protein n=1 Tax=Sphingomonas sp. 28-62-11 TaxID=1970432 RepID=UPI000BD18C48|nr:MAG: hypothetical protein B7Y49_06590 [Sphingomonas sp. 28-62-11]
MQHGKSIYPERQFRASWTGFSLALCAVAVVATLVWGNGNTPFPKASSAGPRLHTEISIGSGSLQVSFNLNIN